MSAVIIDGRATARSMREELSAEVEKLKKDNITPGLGVILVGKDPASQSYVRGKKRACEKIGVYSEDHQLGSETGEDELIALIEKMNDDPAIHGILVQLPLPDHIDTSRVLLTINHEKDVDGFHPFNVGRMVAGEKTLLPCTPHGILQLLLRYNIRIEGANVVIVGRSNIVGKPLANMMMQKSPTGNATVTVCHSRTRDLAWHCRRADICVAAVGKTNTITADMVKEGAVVVDVGVNRVPDETKKKGYRLAGDVDFDRVKEKASYITPVPGGVGPMTITMLLYNTVESAKTAGHKNHKPPAQAMG